MPVTTQPLPTLLEQAERLVQLDVHTLAGIPEVEIRRAVAAQPGYRDALLVISREALAPSSIALLLRLDGKPGFVVEDMTDLDDFTPIAEAEPPESRLYLVHRVDRGDDLANWSPQRGALRTRPPEPQHPSPWPKGSTCCSSDPASWNAIIAS